MKTNFKKILLFLICSISYVTYGNTVFRLGYAYSNINSDAFSSYHNKVNGSAFNLSIAERVSILEYGLAYNKGSYNGTLNHDNSDIQFNGDYSRISLDSKIFFNRHFFLQVGYGLTSSKFNLETPVTEYQKNSIYNLYSLQDSNKSGSLYYGIGIDIFDSKKFNINVSITQNKIDVQKTETSALIGLKMSFDSNLKNFLNL